MLPHWTLYGGFQDQPQVFMLAWQVLYTETVPWPLHLFSKGHLPQTLDCEFENEDFSFTDSRC